MIVDTVENMKLYYSINPAFKKIEAFLVEYAASPKPDGKYELDGEKLFANISSYKTSSAEGKLPEAHRSYADVQVMLKGRETIGWAPLKGLKEEKESFSQGGDAGFYSGAEYSDILLNEGVFALFLPQDAHMPCIGDGAEVTKAVFKVLL